MELVELISRFALALGIGLLIGLERGWRQREASPGGRAAGIRTFALSGLLGGVIAALAQALGGAATASGGIVLGVGLIDRKSTRLNSSHLGISYAVFCLKKKKEERE